MRVWGRGRVVAAGRALEAVRKREPGGKCRTGHVGGQPRSADCTAAGARGGCVATRSIKALVIGPRQPSIA